MVPELRRHADAEALSDAVADDVAAKIGAAIAARGKAVVVLAGGKTPRGIYERLAARTGAAAPSPIAWEHVVLAYGDERAVPPDDAASNHRMVMEALVERLPSNARPTLLRVPGELGAEAAATAYEAAIADLGVFDVVMLGMGDDGHVASIFPATIAGKSEPGAGHAVMATTSPIPPLPRVSMTLERLSKTRALMMLVTGAGKAARLAEAWGELAYADRPWSPRLPAARLAMMVAWDCAFAWHADEAAAAAITNG